MRRATRLFGITALVLSVAVVVIGCGGDSDDESGAASAKSYDVVMVSGPAGDDFYYTIEKAAREEATKLGVDLEIQQPPNFEASSQAAIVDAAIAKRPDVILLAPVDAKALNASAERAIERGIPVITLDGNISDESLPSTYVSADTVDIGRNGAREMIELTGGKGKIFYAGSFQPKVSTFFDRIRAGWEEVMAGAPEIDEAQITYSDLEPTKASQQMQATLSANADLVGGWLGTTLDLEGNVPVLRRADKAESLKTVAVDASPPNVEKLRAKQVDAIISVKAADYGIEAVRAAAAVVDGKTLPKFTKIGQCTLTPENIDAPENAACVYLKAES